MFGIGIREESIKSQRFALVRQRQMLPR